MKKKQLCLLFFLHFSIITYSQQKFDTLNFKIIDSISRTKKFEKDIFKLTNDLTKAYSQDILKVRAIFIWITDNIKYDYKFINKGKEIQGPDCEGVIDCTSKTNDWENDYLRKILKKKKGICDGYSRVFKKMCDIAGIKSEIVSGYTKNKPYQIGTSLSVNHSWNAVFIDSAYYFLDATWAAGKCIEDEETEKLTKYVKDFDNYYWLIPFEKLKRNHYPQNGKWVYEQNYTKEKFVNNPYYSNDILSKINLMSPTTGIIPTKKGDTIHFKFSYDDNVNLMQLNSNVYSNPTVHYFKKISRRFKILTEDTIALKKQKYLTVKKVGTLYEFDYVVTDNSLYYLDILFDYKKVLRFKVKTDIP